MASSGLILGVIVFFFVGLLKSSVQDMPLELLTSLTCTKLDQVYFHHLEVLIFTQKSGFPSIRS